MLGCVLSTAAELWLLPGLRCAAEGPLSDLQASQADFLKKDCVS